MKKVEVLGAFFTSIFTGKTDHQEFQAHGIRGKVWSKEDLLLVEEDQAREHFNKLDWHKSVWSNGLQLRVLKELADTAARPHLIVSEQLW